MVRTQIQLTNEQSRKLKGTAARRGVSVAELIRQGVDAILQADTQPSEEEKRRRAAAAAGRFRSSSRDISVEHDRYLEQAFSE